MPRKLKKGNETALPYGLCKEYGIPLKDGAKPSEAWQALKWKTGHDPEYFFRQAERKEKAEQDAKKAAQYRREALMQKYGVTDEATAERLFSRDQRREERREKAAESAKKWYRGMSSGNAETGGSRKKGKIRRLNKQHAKTAEGGSVQKAESTVKKGVQKHASI